eukprot:TRINITY_DN27399_c0_g1_i1.p2 TRINITY_DN27399_c0_g1~~TRINITY_DN27399_c0_g1_i1.p2  ORF type:complete len:118 (-),score=14.85 TRINITY_DN27399_c0_g1_i1:61-414(-)
MLALEEHKENVLQVAHGNSAAPIGRVNAKFFHKAKIETPTKLDGKEHNDSNIAHDQKHREDAANNVAAVAKGTEGQANVKCDKGGHDGQLIGVVVKRKNIRLRVGLQHKQRCQEPDP